MDRHKAFFSGIHVLLLIVTTLFSQYLPQAYAGGPIYEEGLDALARGDVATAIQLWKPLAEHGDADAQFALGSLYYDGIGVAVDHIESSYWFQLAAEQGLAEAQYNLGNAYLRGEGVRQNNSMAIYWWEKAAKQGLSDAQSNLDRAYQEKSRTDISKQSAARIYGKPNANPSDPGVAVKHANQSWPTVNSDIEYSSESATDKKAVSAPGSSIQTPSEPVVAQAPDIAVFMPADKSGDWAINLVSYTHESAARRTLDQYRKLGIDAEIQSAIVKEKPIYRVRIVGYESLQAALAQITPLQELLDLDSIWASRK